MVLSNTELVLSLADHRAVLVARYVCCVDFIILLLALVWFDWSPLCVSMQVTASKEESRPLTATKPVASAGSASSSSSAKKVDNSSSDESSSDEDN